MTPKAVWDKLENQYLSKMMINKFFVKKRLYNLNMLEVSDMQQHVDHKDKEIVLFCLLLGSCVHLVTTITYGKDTISLDVNNASL